MKMYQGKLLKKKKKKNNNQAGASNHGLEEAGTYRMNSWIGPFPSLARMERRKERKTT